MSKLLSQLKRFIKENYDNFAETGGYAPNYHYKAQAGDKQY